MSAELAEQCFRAQSNAFAAFSKALQRIISNLQFSCCIAAEMNRGKFNILKWDKKQQRYYPVTINLNEKGEIDEQDKL